MHSFKTDRNKHLKVIKRIRGCKSKSSITSLSTSAGDYHGSDTLEGFAKDAEILGRFVGESGEYDNSFYRLCVQDNIFIFDFETENSMKIPRMKLVDLDKIIDKEMKYGKACDIYNSVTWSAHVRILFRIYNLPDPLTLLCSLPWPKERWKSHTKTAVLAYHEAVWRNKAADNPKLTYLNVEATGLNSRPHPMLSWILTTQDVMLARPHIRMLAGDLLCYSYLDHERGIDPHCRLCQALSPHPAPAEDYEHILTRCRATTDTRCSKLPGLYNTIAQFNEHHKLLTMSSHPVLTQFIIDCSSLNLPADTRIPSDHPGHAEISKQCSIFISAIVKERTRQLTTMGPLGG